jgi:hypothetical protein
MMDPEFFDNQEMLENGVVQQKGSSSEGVLDADEP